MNRNTDWTAGSRAVDLGDTQRQFLLAVEQLHAQLPHVEQRRASARTHARDQTGGPCSR